MKIDEASINHNAMRIITDYVDSMLECCEDENYISNKGYVADLTYVAGICKMADEMKKLLRV